MKWYLKQYDDGGWEYSPCSLGKLKEGFEIVDEIPKSIIDATKAALSEKSDIDKMKERLAELESEVAKLKNAEIIG